MELYFIQRILYFAPGFLPGVLYFIIMRTREGRWGMYKIAICDDNGAMRRYLHKVIIGSKFPCQVKEFEDGLSLLKDWHGYDVLFLDIDMPVIDGIETAVKIRDIDKRVKIIYVTGYEGYMQQSFQVHPFAFLTKPVDETAVIQQLRDAVSYEKVVSKEGHSLRFDTLEGIVELPVMDIFYIEYQNRKIRIVAGSGEYFMKGRITDISERMEPYGFAAPHKSFSVNLYYIKSIKGYDIHLMNGDIIPLSQKRSVEFRGKLGRFQAQQI